MALNKAQLEADILAIINAGGPDRTMAQVVAELATAIDDYVKTGAVVVTGGSSAGTYPVE
jgi:hypothetical protein